MRHRRGGLRREGLRMEPGRSVRAVHQLVGLGRTGAALPVHLIFELIDVNLVFSVVPSVLIMTMIAREIPAAINPYSMAVAPVSSIKKSRMSFSWLDLAGAAVN